MIKARVFFFDGSDILSGEWYSLAEAIREDFIVAEDDILKPFDECSIICQYNGEWDQDFWDKYIYAYIKQRN